ncbi:NAD(P)-dependent oxidoreductase [Sporosarcina luteola]|nr:NAD(P)-dependent oxidoreductase [Sporosarcina luteola]MCM3709120.1 NAD(P)-dependent oxidoreductase [Sporosarcina luteola]
MKIGIIGLGNMGSRITQRFLEAGVEVGVYDSNEQAMNEMAAVGADIERTPAQLASNYPYVTTLLPNASIVKEIVLGDDGLVHGMSSTSLFIEMSTSEPSSTKELNAILTSKGFRMIDAPVSGGVSKARNGSLTIMAGGEEEDYEEVQPLLSKIGENVIHVGAIGAGHTIKALNNMISATTLAVTGEAIALGVKLGLDPTKMLSVINTSTGRSASSEVKFPGQILNRKFDSGFTLDLMVKDLTIANHIAETENVSLDIANANLQVWKKALEQKKVGSDHTLIVKHIEEKYEVEIKGVQDTVNVISS